MSLMGDEDDMLDGDELDVEGDVLGDGFATVGRRRRMTLRRRGGHTIRVPRKPRWRRQIAPGVSMPGQGLEPLPLVPSAANGIFAAATTTISFTARPQAPFRGERLLSSVRRSGAAGIIVLATSIFVGRELQLVQTGSFDIEFFSPTAFGVRLDLVGAQPGVDIRIDCVTSAVPAGADTLAVSLMILGRTIR